VALEVSIERVRQKADLMVHHLVIGVQKT